MQHIKTDTDTFAVDQMNYTLIVWEVSGEESGL